MQNKLNISLSLLSAISGKQSGKKEKTDIVVCHVVNFNRFLRLPATFTFNSQKSRIRFSWHMFPLSDCGESERKKERKRW